MSAASRELLPCCSLIFVEAWSMKVSIDRYQLHLIKTLFLKTANSLCQTNSSLNSSRTLTFFPFLFVISSFFCLVFVLFVIFGPRHADYSLPLNHRRAWCVWLNLESNLFSKGRHSIIQSLQTAWVTVCFLLISMCLCVCVFVWMCVLLLVTLVSSFACVCLLLGYSFTNVCVCVVVFMNAHIFVCVDILINSTPLHIPANQVRWFSALMQNFQRSHQMLECALPQMGWLPS